MSTGGFVRLAVAGHDDNLTLGWERVPQNDYVGYVCDDGKEGCSWWHGRCWL